MDRIQRFERLRKMEARLDQQESKLQSPSRALGLTIFVLVVLLTILCFPM